MKQLIIPEKVQKEMLTDFMIMRETKGLNEQKDRKTDRKTTQVIEEENKTVRVGYFPYANFQEGGYGEHKQGAVL